MEPPIAHAEHEAGIHQQARIALEVLLEPCTPEAPALGDDLRAGTPTQARCGEHVFPGHGRLLDDLGLDLLVEAIVGSGVAVVGDRALAVAEMLGQREQGGAVAQRRAAGEGLAALMRRLSPWCAGLDTQRARCRGSTQIRQPRALALGVV